MQRGQILIILLCYKDILGNPRPNPSGTAPDIGAYENVNSVTDAPMPARNFIAKAISYGAHLNWSPSRRRYQAKRTRIFNIKFM